MNTVAIFKPGYNHKDINTHKCALASEGLKTAPWQSAVALFSPWFISIIYNVKSGLLL